MVHTLALKYSLHRYIGHEVLGTWTLREYMHRVFEINLSGEGFGTAGQVGIENLTVLP